MALPIIPAVKLALDFGIGLGIDTIVKGIIVNNVVPGTLLSRASVKVAGYATTFVVSSAIASYINKQIDEQLLEIAKTKAEAKEAEVQVETALA